MTSTSIQYAWEYLYLNSKHLSIGLPFPETTCNKILANTRGVTFFLLDPPPFEHLGLAVRINAFTGYLRLRRLVQPNPLAP